MNLSRHGTSNGGTAFERSGGVVEGCFGVFGRTKRISKGLILAQNERWRRGLGMQVVRTASAVSGARVSNAKVTNPGVGHNRGKLRVIPSDVSRWHHLATKGVIPL